MIIEGSTVLTGSFNFTKAAEESNAENLLVIKDAALAKKYTANWAIAFAPFRTLSGQAALNNFVTALRHACGTSAAVFHSPAFV
jgi:phosphatidylserine/phosphatidylglycerophosphate/cardiolipin synthase-like enzyme